MGTRLRIPGGRGAVLAIPLDAGRQQATRSTSMIVRRQK
jgi:hypothetical protein